MHHKSGDEFRIIILTFILMMSIILLGIGGFMLVEGWPFMDALFMTVTTISTVGFGEVHPLSVGGRIVTMFLILFAIALFGYFFSKIVTVMVEGRIRSFIKGRKMEQQIENLKDHFIICGYGRMGSQVAAEFQQSGVPFVVIDSNPSSFEREEARGILHIIGDACREEDLERCRIVDARGLVCVLAEDQHNVYAVLTARGMNAKLHIVTRAIERGSENKLKRAGADHVISPFIIGGSRIASIMLRPSVAHFLDGLRRAEEIQLTMVEVEVASGSRLVGVSIRDSGITGISESIIIGLRHKGTSLTIRPPVETVFEAGDQLIVMGRLDAIQKVDRLVSTG
jgi:voltage-gated potassium channel